MKELKIWYGNDADKRKKAIKYLEAEGYVMSNPEDRIEKSTCVFTFMDGAYAFYDFSIEEFKEEPEHDITEEVFPLITNDPSLFASMGFERVERTDKNLYTDEIDTLKFVEYTKKIKDVSVGVTFGYLTEDGNTFTNEEMTVDLLTDDNSVPLNLTTVKQLRMLVELLDL